MTPCQFQVTSSKGISSVVPNMELLYDNTCATKPRRCCRKLVNPSMVDTKPFWTGGTMMTNSARLCQKLGGLKSRLCSMMNLHWKITPKLQQERKEIVMRKLGTQVEQRSCSKREMKRLHDEHVKETSEGNAPIHPAQRSRQRRHQQFEGLEEYNYTVDAKTGWRTYPSKSSSSSTCRTPHFHICSHCTGHAARMHVYIGSSLSCVPKIGHSSTRHVSLCASQYTEHQHKFSLTNFSCRNQTCCPRIHLSTMKIHGRMVHLRNSTLPTSNDLLLERSIAQESELCSRIEETHTTQSKIPPNPLYYSKETIPVGERKWNYIPACKSFEGDSLSAEISKLVMRLVRHHDQDERETDGAVHWNSMVPMLRNAFQKHGGRELSDTDGLQHIYEG